MTTERTRLAALVRFELSRMLSRPAARSAVLVFVALLALSHVDEWRGIPPERDEGMFGLAFIVGAIGLVCFGLAADRRLRFDAYLLANHVTPSTYLAAKALAGAVLVVLYAVCATAVELAMTASPGAALWAGSYALLLVLLMMPLALAVEAFADTAMPLAPVLLVWLATALASWLFARSTLPMSLLGIDVLDPGVWRSLEPLATRSAIVVPFGFAAATVVARFSLPRC